MDGIIGIIKSMEKISEKTTESMNPVKVFIGTVVSENPLRINIEQKITVGMDRLVLARKVVDYQTDMTVNHQTENEDEHTHEVKDTFTGGGSSSPITHKHGYKGRKPFIVHHKLKKGEQVIIMRVQGGQKYLVLDRAAKKGAEDVIWDEVDNNPKTGDGQNTGGGKYIPVTGVGVYTDEYDNRHFKTLKIGETCELEAEVLPKNANNQKLLWESEKPEIVEVSNHGFNDDNNACKVIAKNIGLTRIYVKSKENPRIFNYHNINVVGDGLYDFGWRWVFDDIESTKNIYSGYKLPKRQDHNAIDLSSNFDPAGNHIPIVGKEIKSPTNGEVVRVWRNESGGYGDAITIETDNINPVTGRKIRIMFAHMRDKTDSDKFYVGNKIVTGQLLGHVDRTGIWQGGDGYHLHLAMFDNNVEYCYQAGCNPINPQRFFPRINFTGDLSSEP